MQLDQNPFFRKPITPWYDSNFLCWVLTLFFFLVFVFAVFGIIVASENPVFQCHVWVPSSLAGISLVLAIKIILRLKKRSRYS